MRILIATDAWRPQVNGVVRTYERLSVELERAGHELVFIEPRQFATVPCPTYHEVRLAIPGTGALYQRIEAFKPEAIHIATEGPIGWMVRRYCLSRRRPFTTSFHTRFPEYIQQRFAVPTSWTYALQRIFHNAGAGMMVASGSLARELEDRGCRNVLGWTRGVDTELFRPRDVRKFGRDPVFLYVGRIAVEKNIAAFLSLALPGRKVVVGDGPMLAKLQQQFPGVTFAGAQSGVALAESYASADVLVFPSFTDTFGMVMLEGMASGLPIAALPVTGPIDIVKPGVSGYLSNDLAEAAIAAFALDRAAVRAAAMQYSWQSATQMFLRNVEIGLGQRARLESIRHKLPASTLTRGNR